MHRSDDTKEVLLTDLACHRRSEGLGVEDSVGVREGSGFRG